VSDRVEANSPAHCGQQRNTDENTDASTYIRGCVVLFRISGINISRINL